MTPSLYFCSETSLTNSNVLKSKSSASFHSDADFDERMNKLNKLLEDSKNKISSLEEENVNYFGFS